MKEEKRKFSVWQKLLIALAGFIVLIFLFFAVVFVLLLIIKPYGLRVDKMLPALISPGSVPSSYDHPYLNDDQEALLESVGIDVSEVPTQITSEQEQCAIDAIGADRVNAIANGATPTFGEVLSVEHCF